jgi:excinuclease ABC subunit C
VRALMPFYNAQLRDDKNPLYITITKEKYERVLTARKKEKTDSSFFIGPFPSSKNVKQVLSMIRKIIPYSDHKLSKRACIYSQIGLCSPCPNEIEKYNDNRLFLRYKRNIRTIKNVLKGNVSFLRNELLGNINKLSRDNRFEDAIILRDQLYSLDYITHPKTQVNYYVDNPNFIEDLRKAELSELKRLLISKSQIIKSLRRIECFDISHTSGTNPAASMVTFIEGSPDKSYYRHFKINKNKVGDDISALKEVAKRRLKYFKKWGKPNLIIVDGGKGQLGIFKEILIKYDIPIIGIAKRFESIIIKNKNSNFIQFKIPKGPALYLVQRIRNESHRFAQRYHHFLMKKSLLE